MPTSYMNLETRIVKAKYRNSCANVLPSRLTRDSQAEEKEQPPEINPLTCKGNEVYSCQLCNMKAYYRCAQCRLVFYCSLEHKQWDMFYFHPLVCEAVSYAAAPLPFSVFKEDRQKIKLKVKAFTQKLLDVSLQKAKESLLRNEPISAEYCCSYFHRFCHKLYKKDDPINIEPMLVLVQALAQQHKLGKAKKILLCAELLMLNNQNCPSHIKANYFRSKGIVETAEKDYTAALYSYAEEVYHASEAHNTEHPRVAAGYYNMGMTLLKSIKRNVACSYFNHALDIWSQQVEEVFLSTVEINEASNPFSSTDEVKLPEEEELFLETALKTIMATFLDPKTSIRVEQLLNVECVLAQLHYIQGKYRKGAMMAERANELLVNEDDRPTKDTTPVILPRITFNNFTLEPAPGTVSSNTVDAKSASEQDSVPSLVSCNKRVSSAVLSLGNKHASGVPSLDTAIIGTGSDIPILSKVVNTVSFNLADKASGKILTAAERTKWLAKVKMVKKVCRREFSSSLEGTKDVESLTI